MTYGVCNCVGGPPAYGICGACGIAGAYYTPPGSQQPTAQPQTGTLIIREGLTEDQVRKIIREELANAAKKARRA